MLVAVKKNGFPPLSRIVGMEILSRLDKNPSNPSIEAPNTITIPTQRPWIRKSFNDPTRRNAEPTSAPKTLTPLGNEEPMLGAYYFPHFIAEAERSDILTYLKYLHPIWEHRYSTVRETGNSQRRLLRPVYWLGNWQFACLNYYHPPHGIDNRCVRGEPFPLVLQRIVSRTEKKVRQLFSQRDIPPAWSLNTCLINFYGNSPQEKKREDAARVGEHKDFEPGPIASLSLGERAIFQFVQSHHRHTPSQVVHNQWLEDSSMQLFGGPRCKDKLFHRIQRVDRRGGYQFPIAVEGFHTRRVNFTFRYVPQHHITAFKNLSPTARKDIQCYMTELSQHSSFFRREMDGITAQC